MSTAELSIRLFLQLAGLLLACRAVGLLARRLGQPPVVAEMVTGVLLGPSLLGLLLPGAQGYLFPRASMGVIYALAQVGLVLYMFLVGLEFQVDVIRRRVRSAASVSVAGIIVPFTLGALLALLMVGDARFFAPGVAGWEAMLFMGAAMSITAFPMLARIIHERGLAGTSLGTLALAAGSIDDAAAWCILAVVLASLSRNTYIAMLAVGGGLVYVSFVLLAGRRLLRRFGEAAEREQAVSRPTLSLVLALLMIAAWFTDAVGIHAVFGAFVLGAAMPRGVFAREVRRMLEPLTLCFLVPLFFVYSGLNTRLGLVDSPSMLAAGLAVLLAACLGKGVACWLAARTNGESPRDALAIGTLMNTRGMMELIILNIGLERGIITPPLFTIMVMMAIATTLMTTPVFDLIYRRRGERAHAAASPFEPAVAGARSRE